MKIIGCQLDIVWENKAANFEKVRTLLKRGEVPRGSLLVLPEMFATGFSMNVAGIAERPGGETEAFLKELARRTGIFILGGVVTGGEKGKGRNEAVAIDPAGNLLARYCKMQPFTLGGEADHYQAGNELATFRWESFLVSPFICYDLRFPELFRFAVRRGAQLAAVIADWPIKREHHWVTLLRARAIENQCYVIGVNRCGTDPQFVYPGRSLIVDPHGEVLADAGKEEKLISAEIDLDGLNDWRKEFPALNDMRPDWFARQQI